MEQLLIQKFLWSSLSQRLLDEIPKSSSAYHLSSPHLIQVSCAITAYNIATATTPAPRIPAAASGAAVGATPLVLWLAGLLLLLPPEEPPAAEAELAGRMEEELVPMEAELMEAAEEEEELEAELEDEEEDDADGAGDDAPDAAATG